MRIAYVSAGAAGMYCGSCLNDNALVAALQRLGQDAVLLPTYTRLRLDEPDVSLDRVFFGALNVYLKQIVPALRRGPAAIEWLLDRPALLAAVSRLGSSTDPSQLGALTLSILRGEEGNQERELGKLVAWLRDHFRPGIVHLTNTMFAGFARRLKAELGVPVVCSVQGEELFLDALPEPARGETLDVLAERARDVDLFLAPSRYYADFMAAYLRVDRERLRVVPLGVRLEGYGQTRPERREGEPFVIGYLARIAPEKGLHLLVEAFIEVARTLGPRRARLHVAGYLPPQHRGYLRRLERRLAEAGLRDAWHHPGEVDREGKLRFLSELDVLSVPSTFREPKGRYVLEALAGGVPVVVPRHGSLPEIVEQTGGGLLVEPGSAPELAAALVALARDPRRRERLGRAGREAVARRFSDEAAALATLELYEQCLSRSREVA
jgi:glycosyltransferase involved in cell wall biosynthesis